MAPTIVLDQDNKLYAVVGSPGGSLIINYVAKTLVGLLDWKLDPQVAADLPNVGSRNGPTELEAGTEAAEWKADLEAKGHEVKLIDQNSGIHAIVVTPRGSCGRRRQPPRRRGDRKLKRVRLRLSLTKQGSCRRRGENRFLRKRMKKFLVTGGAGFIGSAVVRMLVRDTPHEVMVVDKLTYAGNLDSLKPVANNSSLQVREGRYHRSPNGCGHWSRAIGRMW